MKKLLFIAFLSSLCTWSSATSEELRLTEMVSKGLANHQDKHSRNPTLGVGLVLSADGNIRAEIAVETQNSQLENYPIVVEMFVDGEFIGKQIKTPTFTKSLGFNLYHHRPFNYQVTATVLHPNRSFTSMVEGTYFPQTSSFNDAGEVINYSCSVSSQDGTSEKSLENLHVERTGETSYLLNLGGEELRFNTFDNHIVGEYRSGDSVESGNGNLIFLSDSSSPITELDYSDAIRTLECESSNTTATPKNDEVDGDSDSGIDETSLELNFAESDDSTGENSNLQDLLRGIVNTE